MVAREVIVFLWSIVVGAILTLIFDFFRLARRNKKTKDIIVYIQDIFFWLIVAIIIIISAFVTNSGELRGYMFVGYALGSMFYLILFSKIILTVFGAVFDTIHKVLAKIAETIGKINFKKKNNKMKQEIWNFCGIYYIKVLQKIKGWLNETFF